RNFYEYDEIFTAPVHGFANAAEYWDRSSSIHYLPEIKRPTLLVNALDDTFLSRESYPYDLARQHRYLFLETPANGGHVGFVSFNDRRHYWSERRAVEFVLAS
ncbi:MAG: alpha/beta hydrolase, partial [Saprospiraceae bacterium]|nr:alpha/beta hydrolase [Saprospiraceae bacterium]